jgi:hypothetical protein
LVSIAMHAEKNGCRNTSVAQNLPWIKSRTRPTHGLFPGSRPREAFGEGGRFRPEWATKSLPDDQLLFNMSNCTDPNRDKFNFVER